MKILKIIAIVVICVLLFSTFSIVSAYEGNMKNSKVKKVSSSAYIDDDRNFSILKPKGWVTDKSDLRYEVNFYSKDGVGGISVSYGYLYADLEWWTPNLDDENEIEKWIAQLVEEFEETGGGTIQVYSEKHKMYNDGVKVTLELSQLIDGITTDQLCDIYTFNDSTRYTVCYASFPDYYDDYLKVGKKSLNSFYIGPAKVITKK